MSLLNLIFQAGVVVQLVIILLIIISLWSWAIIFDKIMKFRLLKIRSDNFEILFENASFDEIYLQAKKNDNHPLARVFIAAMKEWKINSKQIINESAIKKESLKSRINAVMQIALQQSTQRLEHGLSFLAIIGSTAPFVGLFGTVWGIMNSFQGIAASKNTSLAVVAPGIAEALLATGIGLFAAIPAVFFYNIFSSKINHFNERVETFLLRILNNFSRELDK